MHFDKLCTLIFVICPLLTHLYTPPHDMPRNRGSFPLIEKWSL